MKKLLAVIPFIILIIFMSCDRRTSKKEHLEQAVIEFNKNLKTIDINTYYPEYYTETKTDSIVANTFTVNIKNYTLMDTDILVKESIKGIQKTSEYHRVFASDVTVAVSDKIIFNKHISTADFEDVSASTFWQYATLEHVWVNQDQCDTKTLALGISFINPKSNAYKLYEMQIDTNGKEYITLIEDHS
ncbi:hypothetical protein [Psychroserpens sp. SPM9]|uniref:hypothetical protein n=1 Tax=Psychroserpens sp. SPM9 TaxID=2975598 RepID=UPI0021A525C0|nr:hypothetical protein [Psychroserpens sp. SPM9]MDG5491459.1 hypothetical protein [Psychroserpens sp. SPM9]